MGNKRRNPFRFLPMDAARLVCSCLPLCYRPKRIHVSGARYRGRVRGGAIVISNHTGLSDPFLLGTCFWYRRLYFLAAKEVMFNPVIELLLKGVGCIKIDRGGSDIDAIRKCISVLKDGKLISVFPEGGITHTDGIEQVKSGAVLIAMQAGVPIIPVYTRKRAHWWNRQRLVIDDAFDCRAHCEKRMPTVADMARLSELLRERLEVCKQVYEQAD